MKRTLSVILLAAGVGLGLAAACTGPGEAAASTVAAAAAPSFFSAPQPVGAMATCPVMGNTFAIKADTLHSEYQGKHVYFCCPGCKPQFDADPKKYLK